MTDVPIIFENNILFNDEKGVYENDRYMRRDLPPGSCEWYAENKAITFTCPCGCGTVHSIRTDRDVKKDGGWLWNGNTEKPSLTPSIQATTPCRWHGYLTDGVFKPC